MASRDKNPARNADLELIVSALSHARARERAAAAKRLRRLKDPRAGTALLAALHQEIPDAQPPERTWEVQYQLVMALAECQVTEAVPFLRDLAQRDFEATMVYVGIGDALMRLDRADPADPGPLWWCAGLGQPMLLEGAFRATAMLRIVFDEATAARLLALPGLTGVDEPIGGRRFWPAAAAAGWRGAAVVEFLQSCLASERADIQDAAASSLAGNYGKWNPL